MNTREMFLYMISELALDNGHGYDVPEPILLMGERLVEHLIASGFEPTNDNLSDLATRNYDEEQGPPWKVTDETRDMDTLTAYIFNYL